MAHFQMNTKKHSRELTEGDVQVNWNGNKTTEDVLTQNNREAGHHPQCPSSTVSPLPVSNRIVRGQLPQVAGISQSSQKKQRKSRIKNDGSSLSKGSVVMQMSLTESLRNEEEGKEQLFFVQTPPQYQISLIVILFK